MIVCAVVNVLDFLICHIHKILVIKPSVSSNKLNHVFPFLSTHLKAPLKDLFCCNTTAVDLLFVLYNSETNLVNEFLKNFVKGADIIKKAGIGPLKPNCATG